MVLSILKEYVVPAVSESVFCDPPSTANTDDAYVTTSDVAAGIFVELVICVAAILFAVANVTATVRVLRSAACAAALVVMPVAIVTRHSTPDFISAVAAFSVTAAPACPELATVEVKVVVPHPSVTGVDNELMPNVGSTNATRSFTFSGAFNAKRYDTDDGVHV